MFKADVDPRDLTVVGQQLFFSGFSDSAGRELWSTDGTAQDTRMVDDLDPGPLPSAKVNEPPNPVAQRNFLNVDGSLYFAGQDAAGTGLFRSDGKAADTIKLSASASPVQIINIGDTVYYSDGKNLWQSNGTPTGTMRLTGTGKLRFSKIIQLNVLDGELYLLATDRRDSTLDDLVKSDGTAAGTTIVQTFKVPAGRYVDFLTPFNHQMVFQATDDKGNEALWTTDGSGKGTVSITSLFSDSGTFAYGPFDFMGRLYFFVSDPNSGTSLWISDGTANGTENIKTVSFETFDADSLPHFAAINSELYFSVTTGNDDNAQLWKTAGSKKSTLLVKEFGSSAIFVGPWRFNSSNNAFYFATGDVNDEESETIWASLGTAVGTNVLATTEEDQSPYGPELTAFDGSLYFATSKNLWRSSLNPQSIVRGIVYEDDNDNDIKDTKEVGLPGFTVWLDLNNNGVEGADEPHTHTDDAGNFSFRTDQVGSAQVFVDPMDGFNANSNDMPYGVELSPFHQAHVTIGEFKPASITGVVQDSSFRNLKDAAPLLPIPGVHVFLDLNGNGRFDNGEPFARTDAQGQYQIKHLAGGSYTVRQTPIGGPWTFESDEFQPVKVLAGQRRHANFVDAQRAYSVPARAFLDANHDGIFDTGDTPIALDQVFVDLNHNGEDDDGLNYLSLDDGTFTVRLPPGNYASWRTTRRSMALR